MYQNENVVDSAKSDVPTKMPLYLEVKDQQGHTHKVINFANPFYAPFEGIVELAPVKEARGMRGLDGNHPFRHKANVHFRYTRDKGEIEYGMYIGIHRGYEKNGELKFEKLFLNHIEFLDLSKERDRQKYICVKYSPYFQGSPNQALGIKTVYKAVDREHEASLYKRNFKTKRKAIEIAESLYGEELLEVGTLLGAEVKSMSENTLSAYVIKFADNDNKVNGKTGAERFMEVYESESKRELLIYKRGILTGVIIDEPNKGFIYNNISLGLTENEVLAFLKQNPTTATSIDLQARQKQNTSKFNSVSNASKVQAKSPEQAEIENLKRRLAETENQLKESNSIAAEASAKLAIQAEDPELADLIERGKALKIRGAHNFKDKEKAKRLIKEAEDSIKQ